MNDQVQMMNQSQMMNPPNLMNPPKMMNPNAAPMMNQSQMLSMNQPPLQMLNQPPQQMLNQQQQPQMLNQQQQPKPPQLMNQSQAQQMMMSRGGGGGGYGMWPPVQEQLSYNQNPSMNFPGFVSSKPMGRNNWKGKKGINDNKRKDMRRTGKTLIAGGSTSAGGGGGYKPPTLKELQQENRLKARKYFQKKKYDKFNNNRQVPFASRNTSAPFAPRNTSSFIIRAKKSGGIASLVSPCPVTPAVLPTPMFSPSSEVLGDMAKEEWGVDGYGSMNGLIRLRSPGNEAGVPEDDEEEEGGGSSDSDLEEHLEVERRLNHDLSRFEMISPNYDVEYNNVLENRVDDQDSHIAQVEEENLILKDRLFLMERELSDLRRRLLSLERQHRGTEEINDEVVENESENENESRGGYSGSREENNDEVIEENNEGGDQYVEAKEGNDNGDVIVKDMNIVESKEENKNRDVEVNDGNNVDTEVGNGNVNIEVKEAATSFETLNDVVVREVRMEEITHKQDGVYAGVAKLLEQEMNA